jgi:hypothetical protein
VGDSIGLSRPVGGPIEGFVGRIILALRPSAIRRLRVWRAKAFVVERLGCYGTLVDRDFIGFENSGALNISPVAHLPSLQRMGVETQRVLNVGGFTEGQRRFLAFTGKRCC